MAGITTFLDESQMPNRSQEQKVFDNLVAYVFQNFPKWGREVNESLGAFNAALAGSAYALPYIFDSGTADADPGAGKLRLSSATQNTATVMRVDLTAGGQDYTKLIDTMDGSTSIIKGSIRLAKQGDLSKWMTFDVTARGAPAGYRNLAVVCTDSSSPSPFSAGDALMLFFQRNGDRGQPGANGMLALGPPAVITTPVANIDFLNIFSADYDKYTIEVQGISLTTAAQINVVLAYGGTPATDGSYYMTSPGNQVGAPNNAFTIGSIHTGMKGVLTIEIKNVNGAGPKGVSARGMLPYDSVYFVPIVVEGLQTKPTSASGFRLFSPQGAASISAGTVRVFGHRNS